MSSKAQSDNSEITTGETAPKRKRSPNKGPAKKNPAAAASIRWRRATAAVERLAPRFAKVDAAYAKAKAELELARADMAAALGIGPELLAQAVRSEGK